MAASEAERAAVEISAIGLHWVALDEDISVAGLLARCGDATGGRGRRLEGFGEKEAPSVPSLWRVL